MAINYGSKRTVVGAHYGLRDWLAQRVMVCNMNVSAAVRVLMPVTTSWTKWAMPRV